MRMTGRMVIAALVAGLVFVLVPLSGLVGAHPAAAAGGCGSSGGTGDSGSHHNRTIFYADVDGDSANAGGHHGRSASSPSAPAAPSAPRDCPSSNQPNCTKSDGTPGFIHYGDLLVTTQQEQRTEIRPEEQRPGRWAHRYCSGEWVDFVFLPEEVVIVDPAVLAASVFADMKADPPTLAFSPDEDVMHLVHLTSYVWPVGGQEIGDGDSQGVVSVTVTGKLTELRVDWGEGGGQQGCAAPVAAYTAGSAGSCGHTYERSGVYSGSAVVVYQVGWTGTVNGQPVAGNPNMGTITSQPAAFTLEVAEAQAIVVD
ncbi:MAG: hypothetical protein ACRD0U_11695 [Acidimicrobiales bacterium]